MLTGFLHRLVAQPMVYDLCQQAVGVAYVRKRLAKRIAPYKSARMVLDIGGGTGSVRALWSEASRYVCLDIDPLKLEGYRAKNPGALALIADATNLPVTDQSVDAVLCTCVAHHLLDSELDRMLAESARALKPNGRLILLDPVWAPARLPGRVLWKYDRGSHPRTPEQLRQAIGAHFDISQWETFAVLHRYILAVSQPR
jgi:ubiquinone/menaquinone biosynthesis C-methylase UbiE